MTMSENDILLSTDDIEKSIATVYNECRNGYRLRKDLYMKKVLGNYPTMITPYKLDGSVDFGGVRALTEWYWEKGCEGIFAVCQSSEIFELSLADRIAIAKTVKETADRLASVDRSRAPMGVVGSGHISYDFKEQLYELSALADTGIDAVILISNRMDISNTCEDAWIADTERLINGISAPVKLGVYECPRPYKRLLSERMLSFCAQTGRFAFMKDTCCDAAVIDRRLKAIEGTPMRLLNANAQTLLDSLRSGAAGYSGIMANFHPDIISWLCQNFEKEPQKAELVQAFLSTAAFTEHETMSYPMTAKYHLKELEKLPFECVHSRVRAQNALTDYQKACVKRMEMLADHIRSVIDL